MEVDGVAQQVGLGLEPELAEAVGGQLAGLAPRSVCMACSKRFMAIWRNTAATAPSSDPASSDSRSAGPGARSSSRSSTIVSPKIDAVSAMVSGPVNWKMPCGPASEACTPWPSSCASVSTS